LHSAKGKGRGKTGFAEFARVILCAEILFGSGFAGLADFVVDPAEELF